MLFAGKDTSSSVMPEVETAPLAVLMKVTVKDWDDTVEWRENTGSVGGLDTSHTVAPGRTGVEAHWTTVRFCHCGSQEGSLPCVQAQLMGHTESPTMGASFPVGSHWASWSEAMTETPPMTGLRAAGTASVDSLPLDVPLEGSTAERTATGTMDPDSYAATSCTKGALPGGS